ncbi:MAG TPA: hypothetical protein VGJ26_11615 [Pirellulales bacterium]|jgi:hypothetical protein
MTERPALVEEEARRWACAALGVAEDAPQDAVRAAFLKQVGEADFFLSSDNVVAWQTLTGALAPYDFSASVDSSRAERILRERLNEMLRAPIEEFAERFFDVEVSERAEQWFDLLSRCQSSPALVARLRGLSAGLHVDRQAVLSEVAASGLVGAPSNKNSSRSQEPNERTVAEKIFEMFVLRPIDRAERQQEALLAWQTDFKAWQAATRRFKKQFPKIAALDAEFVDTILHPPKPPRLAPATQKEREVATAQATAANKGTGWARSIGVFLVLMCVSAVSRCSREESRKSKFLAPQRQNYPQLQPQPPQNLPTIPSPTYDPMKPGVTPKPKQSTKPHILTEEKIKRARKRANPAISPRIPLNSEPILQGERVYQAESPKEVESAPSIEVEPRPVPDQ